MSTKIYDAYLFHGDLQELIPILQRIRNKWIACHAIFLYKTIKNVHENQQDHSLEHLRDECFKIMNEQSKKSSNLISDYFDVKASCVVYIHDNTTVVQFFMDKNTEEKVKMFQNEITNTVIFSDFHYQNQTDPYFAFDETYADEYRKALEMNWQRRKEFFDNVFKIESMPMHAGLSYIIADHEDCYIIEGLVGFALKNKPIDKQCWAAPERVKKEFRELFKNI